ncbi:hypothetical protein BJM06_a00126 (plasmid) [Enterobacter cloacae]|nr:hypothetical protein BJM06_a00126 [Enterobacter cloacae]
MESRKANVMVVGKTGTDKNTALSQVMRIFTVQSDISWPTELYSGEDGKRLAEGIRQPARPFSA